MGDRACKDWCEALSRQAYAMIRQPFQEGDEVYVQSSFDAPGRFYGMASLAKGTRGVVEKLVEGVDKHGEGVVIRFFGHEGTFLLREDLLSHVESEGFVQSRGRVGVGAAAATALLLCGAIATALLAFHKAAS